MLSKHFDSPEGPEVSLNAFKAFIPRACGCVVCDTTVNASFNNERANSELRKQGDGKLDDEVRREAEQRRDEMNMMEKAGDWLAGAWLSMNNTIGQWGRDVADMVSEFGERAMNWAGGEGFNTNTEIAVAAALAEYDRQSQREQDIAQSGALWEATDEFGNNLMNVYLYQKYAGDKLAMENLGVDAGQAQKAFEDWDMANRDTVLTGGDTSTRARWGEQLTNPAYSPSDAWTGVLGAIGMQIDFNTMILLAANNNYAIKQIITDTISKEIVNSLDSGNIYNSKPSDLIQQVLNANQPELLGDSLGLNPNKAIMDIANTRDQFSAENFRHIEDLVNSFMESPKALESYYNQTSGYWFWGLIRDDNYSAVRKRQYDVLRKLQDYYMKEKNPNKKTSD